VCVAANQIVGGTEVGERLSTLFDAFNALSNANKAARQKLKEHGDGAAEG
jgi:hypothetical protein